MPLGSSDQSFVGIGEAGVYVDDRLKGHAEGKGFFVAVLAGVA